MQESDSAQANDNFLRGILGVWRHLKQCHAKATCEGIQVSMPLTIKCSDMSIITFHTKFLFSDWSKAHHVRPSKYWYWAAIADIGQFHI